MGFADDVESIIGFLPKEGVQKVVWIAILFLFNLLFSVFFLPLFPLGFRKLLGKTYFVDFFFFFVLRKKTFFSSYLVDPASVDLVGSDGSTAASKTVRHLAIACDPRERSSVLADVVKVEQFESRVRLRCDALIHRCTVPTQR